MTVMVGAQANTRPWLLAISGRARHNRPWQKDSHCGCGAGCHCRTRIAVL